MEFAAELFEKMREKNYPLPWLGHRIGEHWVKSMGEKNSSYNPSNGKELMSFQINHEVITRALDVAEAGNKRFREFDIDKRIEMIHRIFDQLPSFAPALVAALQIECGKPQWEAKEEVEASIRYLRYIVKNNREIFENLISPARLGRAHGEYHLHPLGITSAYLPFSTPLTSFIVYLTASMIAGCPLVLFIPSSCVLIGTFLALLVEKSELPHEAVAVLFSTYEFFKHSLNDRRIAAVIYTGSKEHCDELQRDGRSIRNRQLILQSGGKNSCIVHSSADLDLSVNHILMGVVKSSGQLCSATSRVFVYSSILPQFIEKLVASLNNMTVGATDVLDEGSPQPIMGPLYSKKAVERFLRFQTMANREAKQTLFWGRAIVRENQEGNFITPGVHLMKSFDSQSAYQSNVIFAPDLAIYEYEILDEAINHMNTTEALVSSAFFGDLSIAESRSHLFTTPNLLINLPTVEAEATLPLAGRTKNGNHRYLGPGLALYLCYPQVIIHSEEYKNLVENWPKVK